MSPEELFKIEDTEIPEATEEGVIASDENVTEKPKIDIFDKDLSIEDLMDFLKNNNMPNDPKIVEKYYEDIVTNNIEKETITESIKQLDSEKETIIQQIEVKPNDSELLKKINDLEEKISDLNTEERIKEDNVKTIIREISKVDIEKSEPENTSEIITEQPKTAEVENINPEETGTNQTSEIIPEETGTNQTSEIIPEETGTNQTSEIIPEETGVNQTSEIIPEDVQTNESQETSPDKINQTSNIKIENEETIKPNPLEKINITSSEKEEEFFKTIENDKTLEEVKKNNEMLKEMSKNIDYNLELVLKAISENNKEFNTNERPEIGEVEPNYTQSPKISQPQYIDEYRKSLRKYGGMESFMGYDIPFKGDNLGSYI